MQSRLPEFCDLYQLADKAATMSGSLPIAKMPRLIGMLTADSGEAQVELEFGKSGRTRYVKGQVVAKVEMQCQRCLGSTSVTLDAEFSLALLEDEAHIEKIADQFEPLITEGRHYLPDVIEDELILAVPIVATHDSECSSYMQQYKTEPEEKLHDESGKQPNPFAALKDLL